MNQHFDFIQRIYFVIKKSNHTVKEIGTLPKKNTSYVSTIHCHKIKEELILTQGKIF